MQLHAGLTFVVKGDLREARWPHVHITSMDAGHILEGRQGTKQDEYRLPERNLVADVPWRKR